MSSSGRWERKLPAFSLHRRITVFMLMVVAVVLGTVAVTRIPLELVPRGFERPQLGVTASWRDAPPQEMLDKVVMPLEEELSTVAGLDSIGASAGTQRARIYLRFKTGTDMDIAYREVRDGVLRAGRRLPEDIEPVQIQKHSDSAIPVLVLGVGVDPRVTDMYNLIHREIITPLSRVDGVASVDVRGLLEKEILIDLDREKTAAAGLNIFSVGRELAADNFSMASGSVRHGDRKLLLRSLAQFTEVEQLRQRLVSETVRLGDIATVRYREPERRFRVRVNSRPAFAIRVTKDAQANTIEVGRRLEQALTEIKANPKLAGSFTAVIFSQSELIRESLGILVGSGELGAVLAVVILLFFLRRFRLTLIITLSIPASMLIALITMYFAGETLNVLTMLGLIISVGLLVDNSVVVAENVIRLHRDGLPRKEAAIAGAAEIALAIILATLTTIIVFLPVALVDGPARFMLARLALPISVSLVASLFVALIFVPLCVYLTLGVTDPSRESRPVSLVARLHRFMDRVLGRVYDQSLGRVARGYDRLLRVFLRRRLDLVVVLAAVFGLVAALSRDLDIEEVADDDRRNFEIDVDLPRNYSFEDTTAYFDEVERIMERAKPELGIEAYVVVHGTNSGDVEGWFPRDSKQNRQEVIKRIKAKLPKRAGVKLYAGSEDRDDQKAKKSTYSVALTGEDAETLEPMAAQIEQMLRGLDGVLGIKRADELRPNELGLVLDRSRAERQGVSPEAIAGVVSAGLRGRSLPYFHQEGKEIPVRLRFQESDRDSLQELSDFAVPGTDGSMVQLRALTDVRIRTSPGGIFRQDKRVTRRISVELDEKRADQTRRRIDRLLASLSLPEGVRLDSSEAARQVNEDAEQMKFASLISVLFIYLLMAFLFESFVLPLSIIVTIPLAGIGVMLTHVLAGRNLDVLGLVGVVLLIGVVVNNGIVFVDYVNRLRKAGLERAQAVLLSARHRFRPIMMTAGTTICGMIPLTLGEPTKMGLSYRSFGLTLMGGMATATLLTLLVIPVFYTLLDDGIARVLRQVGILRKPPGAADAEAEASPPPGHPVA